jgi:hypothetical protein
MVGEMTVGPRRECELQLRLDRRALRAFLFSRLCHTASPLSDMFRGRTRMRRIRSEWDAFAMGSVKNAEDLPLQPVPGIIGRRLPGTPGDAAAFAFDGYGVIEQRVSAMAVVRYRVAPTGEKWLVTRDDERGMSYISQEAAYEVAVAEAAGDLRTGNRALFALRCRC